MDSDSTRSPRSEPLLQRAALGSFFGAVGLLFLLAVALGNQKTRPIPGDPGPWMLPVVLGIVLLLGGITQIVVSLRKTPPTNTADNSESCTGQQLALLGGVILYVIALHWLGFVVATPILVTAMLRCMRVNWWKSLIAGVVLTGVGHLAFEVGFKTPLPTGFWN